MIAEPLLRIDLVIFRLAADHDRGVSVRVLVFALPVFPTSATFG